MNSIFDIINVPLGYLFKWIYFLVGNYGWTIILFTIVTKFILFPLTLKQQKSMKKTQTIQPQLAKLQEKYKYDQEKLSQETMKLYKESGVNPMGGCLPLLIQFPIIIALYNIIRKPMRYVLMLSNDTIMKISERITGTTTELIHINQIDLANKMGGAMDKISEFVSSGELINFDFFVFNLSVAPSNVIANNWIYALIPIIAGLTTYLQSYIMTKLNGTGSQGDNPAASSMKAMNLIFPIMTAWFAISLPAGLGLYWITSNIFQIGQMFIMNKFMKADAPVLEERTPHYRERAKKKKK